MIELLPLALVIVALGAGFTLTRRTARRDGQEIFIRRYTFPSSVTAGVEKQHPGLSAAQRDQVYAALRDYFSICRSAGQRLVSMPSQVVDDAWHAFILDTQAYHAFCRRAFGKYLHHRPAEAMRAPRQAQAGIKRAWKLACQREGIDPVKPARLPLLFAIDALLNIPHGFTYRLHCDPRRGDAYCASHISCASGCGGTSGCSGIADGGGGDAGGSGCSSCSGGGGD